jgi:hypothetical protein
MRRLLFVLLGASVGCVQPFETPSAYEAERYLCDPAAATQYAAAVSDCQTAFDQNRGCGGVISYRGKLEGRALTVDSTLGTAQFLIQPGPMAGQTSFDGLSVTGASPYFAFLWRLQSAGGDANATLATAQTYSVDERARKVMGSLSDNQVDLSMRLEGGGQSVGVQGLTGGTLTITRRSMSRVEGTFSASFTNADDKLDGCFVVLPLEVAQIEL